MQSETCPPIRQGIRPSTVHPLCREGHSGRCLTEDRRLRGAIPCCATIPTRYAPATTGSPVPRLAESRQLQIRVPVLPSLTPAPAQCCEEPACVPDRPSSERRSAITE